MHSSYIIRQLNPNPTLYCKFPADCDRGKNSKIGPYLIKLCLFFSRHGVVSKVTSHCADTEQQKKDSEIGIRKREEIGFKTRAKGRGRWSSGDMRWKTVHRRADAIGNTQSQTVDSRVRRTARDIDEAERKRCVPVAKIAFCYQKWTSSRMSIGVMLYKN